VSIVVEPICIKSSGLFYLGYHSIAAQAKPHGPATGIQPSGRLQRQAASFLWAELAGGPEHLRPALASPIGANWAPFSARLAA